MKTAKSLVYTLPLGLGLLSQRTELGSRSKPIPSIVSMQNPMICGGRMLFRYAKRALFLAAALMSFSGGVRAQCDISRFKASPFAIYFRMESSEVQTGVSQNIITYAITPWTLTYQDAMTAQSTLTLQPSGYPGVVIGGVLLRVRALVVSAYVIDPLKTALDCARATTNPRSS